MLLEGLRAECREQLYPDMDREPLDEIARKASFPMLNAFDCGAVRVQFEVDKLSNQDAVVKLCAKRL
jgi:hypothetical protein